MDIHKVSYLALLLLFGMISHVEHADAKPCFKNCDPRLAYEICPRPEISNKVDSNRICVNCCSGKKGCSYFGPDGSFICKGESDPEHPKACPLNCDPRIVSGICPLSENKKPKVDFNRLCINCCSGKKGCSYFGEDGSFICKGESDPENPKACPLNCDPRIVSGICPLSENKKPKVDFNRLCINCCSGKKGCSYFGEDGSFICKGESDPENPKACPLYCDLRIVTGICPVSENKKPKVERLCTNCCAGKKGCYYYNADREFICEGESEYDSHKIMSVVS